MIANPNPPRIAAFVLGRVLDQRDREYVLGDLSEEYARICRVRGERAARSWYRGEVLHALVPAVRRRLSGKEWTMGNPTGKREERTRGSAVLGEDVRQAWRGLTRRPGLVVMAVLTLGIAIGSNAATFGVVDAVLLRSMPYPAADRIVSFSELHGERMQELGWVSIPNFVDWRDAATQFETMSLFRGRSMALTGDGDPLYVYGAFATPGFFETFGTAAARGRVFREEEDGVGTGGSSVVLSHGLWQRGFGGDASVVGRTIMVDGISREVIGIMPAEFNAPGDWIGPSVQMDLWIPFAIDASQEARGSRSFNAVGRIGPDVTVEAARAEMQGIAGELARAHPDANEGWNIRLLTWKEVVVGHTRRLLFPLWGAMALLLLVACANVGNLILNRSLARRAEFATRTALGAGGGRLVSQTLIESMIIGIASAGLGVIIAQLILAGVRYFDPGLPRLSEAAVDARVLLVSVAIGVLVGSVLAVIPAVRAARSNVHDALRESWRVYGTSGSTRRARDAMVVLQLALALALLAGSALIVRGFLRVRAVSPGFDADGILVATVALSWDRVAELERRTAFTAGVLERLRAIPGVESAAMINSLPFSGSNQQQTFEIAGKPLDERSPPFASLRGVSPQYVRTMRIPLLRGREFIESDLAGPMRVVLINEALAGSYLAGGDAVGQRLVLFGGDVNAEIVGVVDNVRHFGLDQDVMPEIYFPYTADFLTSKSYVVRTSGDPHALAAAVRAAIHEVDPAQPLRAAGPDHAETMTLASMIDESLAGPRFYTLVLVLLSSVALVLAAVGLFGVVAISVTERQREIGLRMALGAERMSVLMWILGRIGRVAALAMACGLLIIFATGSTIEAFLHGVSARDPVALTLAITTFCAITIVAVVLPASRVLQLDAARVLRQE